MVNGNFDTALDLVRSFTTKHEVTLVNSVNPYRLEGQKTAAFEIVDSLGDAPDYLFIPVGNAGQTLRPTGGGSGNTTSWAAPGRFPG